MLEPEQVLEIAIRLHQQKDLDDRRFECWYAARYEGMSFRVAAEWLRQNRDYDISHFTVMMDSRYAHEIIVAACEEVEQGRVRFGHTLAGGSEAWWSPDTTAQKAARKLKAVGLAKKKKQAALIDYPLLA